MQDQAHRHHARGPLNASRRRHRSAAVAFAGFALVVGVHACVEVPPKIAAIPASGLSLRIYAFGASAQEARRAFEAVHQNNTTFTVVNEGGDGEVLIGLENDSPKCVPPTALCSLKVSFRIRDNKGEVLHASTTSVSASSDRCSELCTKALNNVAVKVVEAAAGVLKGGGTLDASLEGGDGVSTDASTTIDAAPAVDAAVPAPRGSKKGAKAEPPPKPQPAICSVANGPRLPAEEAEKRAAQVEVLKRLSIIDQDEYDCLRKAYLARL